MIFGSDYLLIVCKVALTNSFIDSGYLTVYGVMFVKKNLNMNLVRLYNLFFLPRTKL